MKIGVVVDGQIRFAADEEPSVCVERDALAAVFDVGRPGVQRGVARPGVRARPEDQPGE